MQQRQWSTAPSWAAPVVATALAVLIFILDTVTDLEIAVAVFYVAVILLSVGFLRRRGILLVALGCLALTVTSYLLTPSGARDAGLINCVISLTAIGTTTYLVLRSLAAEVAAQDARTQLAHMARVTALGELTTSIAHEVNQPLGAIASSADSCLRWLAADPPNIEKARTAAERVVKDAGRAGDVIARIRNLVKRAPPERDRLDVNQVVLEVVALTRTELEQHGVSLRLQLHDGLPMVLGDRVQLQQVVLNLVLNAIEAMRDPALSRRELTISSAADPTDAACVLISDSGTGLDAGRAEAIFEGFQTTKQDGIGMGLTISRSIVEAHGGRIWATPGHGGGAVLHFTLPTAPSEAP